MNFDVFALWTGRILLLSIAWMLICSIWYVTITWLWNAHKNLMLTRKFCIYIKGNEFIEWVQSGKYKEEVRS